MPPLDFPANPVDGQLYQDFIYDATVGVWRAQASGGGFPISVANGGTGATTVAGAQDSLRVGLVPMSPSTVEKAGTGSTATANTLGMVTFAGCTSLSLNGVFSASYSKYLLYISGAGGTATADIFFRLRTSGGVDATTAYYQQQLEIAGGAVNGVNAVNIGAGNIGVVGAGSTSGSSSFVFHNPASAVATNFTAQFFGTPGGYLGKSVFGYHSTASAYTGITIYSSTGALSGSIQIFGLNE